MAYTFRNLIIDAFNESGVKGGGMVIDDEDESRATSKLNLILTEIFANGCNSPMSAVKVTFDGKSDYTIGPAPTLVTEPQPDIIIDVRPNIIDKIMFNTSGVRNIAYAMSPDVYYSRSLDTLNNSIPTNFYYEQSNPLGTIRFYEGQPSGPGELIMTPSLTNITANTDFKYFPPALQPYLVTELAARILTGDELDASHLKLRSHKCWVAYKNSIHVPAPYIADISAPGYCGGNGKYNIYRGR